MVLLGFQMASFSWRISREQMVGKGGDITWLPPAELMNMAAMLFICFGVFILPLSRFANPSATFFSFAIAIILFAGYPFALAGHYDLFRSGNRTMKHFTSQEKIAVVATVTAATVFALYTGTKIRP